MDRFSYNEHQIETDTSEPTLAGIIVRDLVRDLCIPAGFLKTQEMIWNRYPESIAIEECEIPKQNIATASLAFERNRLKVIKELRAIVRGIMKEYELPINNGIDIGSGGTGAMVGELLPTIRHWTEMDINPAAVRENKRRHPRSRIVCGSYFRLQELAPPKSVDIVTGLSSLDNTNFLPLAVDSIWSVLKPGGFLFHVQDVRPGNWTTVRWVRQKGYIAPHSTDVTLDGGIYGLHDPQEKYISAAELLRRELGEVIGKRDDADLVLNAWTTARISTHRESWGGIYYQNVAISGTPNTPLPETIATAVVTIARKK